MSQVTITCPRCKEKFTAEKADIYECPLCGTNVRAKRNTSEHEKTQNISI